MKLIHPFFVLTILVILLSMTTGVVHLKTTDRRDKMLRLCLWTQCRAATSSKKCPVYLEQSARRKCKLESGEIGYYSKCCLYEEPFNLQKTTAT